MCFITKSAHFIPKVLPQIDDYCFSGDQESETIVQQTGPIQTPSNSFCITVRLASFNANNYRRDTQEAEIQGSDIPPNNNAESAIVVTLSPASYATVIT